MISNSGPVFPVLPCYLPSGQLDLRHTATYVKYLQASGVKTVMTTAGTSQFNLLSGDEILELNSCVAANFSGRIILGAPPLAEILLEPFLSATIERHPSAELLLTYPERLYRENEVVEFFIRVARACPTPVNIHGLPLRQAQGGLRDFTSSIIDEILKGVGNVSGMKEECSTYESGFRLCSAISKRHNFEFIVAGGSMRRFMLLQAGGAQSFFAGIGSLFPSVELDFMRHIKDGNLSNATLCVSALETPAFEVFMDIGWHKALRYAAKCMGLISAGERQPMTEPNREERARIECALATLRKSMTRLTEEGALSIPPG